MNKNKIKPIYHHAQNTKIIFSENNSHFDFWRQ